MKFLAEKWIDLFNHGSKEKWWQRKNVLMENRQAEIVRISGKGHFYEKLQYDDIENRQYMLHLRYYIKQLDFFYVEEQVIPYTLRMKNGKIVSHEEISYPKELLEKARLSLRSQGPKNRFTYDRHAAVQYAEYWWNSYNPQFQKFTVDCTNFISQCLLAGGAPMQGAPNREKGWWYADDDWSFSWSVAHSLRWYLSGATSGLTGKEVANASDLNLGDVICYDFQGDGRWDHNTIVVAKDINGEPLVNAHTDNSRHRFWSYEDSTAWTPQIKYKFFQIG